MKFIANVVTHQLVAPVVAQQIVRRFSSLSARVVGVKNASGTMHARGHRVLIFDK
ncbi:MAG: hypothetical protein GMKNLPBB_03328 [Myxococcota bacterium]|nr:hypothetical protein [Myxococcota bacterium]